MVKQYFSVTCLDNLDESVNLLNCFVSEVIRQICYLKCIIFSEFGTKKMSGIALIIANFS